VTITQSQRDTYQSKVREFAHQKELNSCLGIALKNIIDELAIRIGEPGMQVEREDVLDWVDYDETFGCTSDFLPQRLNPHLQDYNMEVNEARSLSQDDLESLIDEPQASYPITELDSRYQEYVDVYDSIPGQAGNRTPHTVIPFGFNDETVLLFDPALDYHAGESVDSVDPVEVAQPLFYEWWKGESSPKWALWIEQRAQTTLGTIGQMGENNEH
jgi:hypothetical protein